MAIFVTRQGNSFFTVISETAVGREKYVCKTQDTNLKLMNPLSSAWLQLLLTSWRDYPSSVSVYTNNVFSR